MSVYNYKKLTPFKWFVLENFPFIEADFDALTEWQLFCKIGKEINKIINSVNLSGEEVEQLSIAFNDLQNYVNESLSNLNLQQQVNNKLNEMAESGELAEIIDQEIFAEINNKLNNLDFVQNDILKLIFPYRGQNSSDCCIIQENNKTIISDLGSNINELIGYLTGNNINKIDYIILSHYHQDHIGGTTDSTALNTLLNTQNIDFSNLVFYLPHKGIEWNRINDTNKTLLQNAENTIKQLIQEKGYTYIEPDNEQILTLSSICNIKFLNIGSTFYNYYYGDYGNEYNNFSMVFELTHNNRVALFTGDIFTQAQEQITPYIKQPDILKCPHHDLELVANELFMRKLTPEIMIFQENQSYYPRFRFYNYYFTSSKK